MFIEFFPPGTKRYNETILCRQGPKGTMEHFVPPGTKGNENILCRQGPNSKRHMTPSGSGYCENWLGRGKKKDPTS